MNTPPKCLGFENSSTKYSFETDLRPYGNLSLSEKQKRRQELSQALDEVPLIVFAEDDDMVRKSAGRLLRSVKQDGANIIDFSGNIPQAFENAKRVRKNSLSVITCQNGHEAQEAVRILASQNFQSGIIALDYHMYPGPTGLEIFRQHSEGIPTGMARVLQSSEIGLDLENEKRQRVLDGQTAKPSMEAIEDYLRFFLRRNRDRISHVTGRPEAYLATEEF